MTTYNNMSDINRGSQDGIERHVWGELEYVDGAGSYLKVSGTGTTDIEVAVVNTGYGFNLAKDSNAEVFVMTDGFDTNQKHAFPTIPRNLQRPWKESTGGVQNPLSPDKALEFNPKRAHIRESNVALGDGGKVEIVGDTIYFRGNVVFSGDLTVLGNMKVGGKFECKGQGVFNGDLSTSLLRTPSSVTNNEITNFTATIPSFEDY